MTTLIAKDPPPAAGVGDRCATAWIVGPLYDGVFFIFSPLLALLLGIGIALTRPATGLSTTQRLAYVLLPAFVGAHLFIVFFRTHGNREIFRRFPLRFTLVPALFLVALWASRWLCVFMVVVAVWWDVYHSSLQTFGLSRMYDKRAGNDLAALGTGYWLDKGLNLLLYVGPILAGATLMDHVDRFGLFEQVGDAFFTAIPARVAGMRGMLTTLVLALCIPYLIVYVVGYRRLLRQGYRVSWQKIALLVATGACSIWSWGFNSFGEAFFIMNFFHALQYFALIWVVERGNMTRLFGLARFPPAVARPMTFALFVVIAAAAGLYMKVAEHDAVSMFVLISILHFWYDGFIWSLRPAPAAT